MRRADNRLPAAVGDDEVCLGTLLMARSGYYADVVFGGETYEPAVLALGQTGTVAHLAILLPHLNASEQFERAAALHALEALSARASPAAVEAHAFALRGDETLARSREALGAARAVRAGRTSWRSQSERREDVSGSARI